MLVVPKVLNTRELTDLRRVIAEIVAAAANVDRNDEIYDLEPTHSRSMPRVRRIKAPTKVHPTFDETLRHPKVLAILTALIRPALRRHGSALNTSNRPRNLLLYEVAAADAWPLMGVKDFDEFNSRMIQGAPTIEPRVTPVPVRMPLPPALRQGSIYENQLASDRTYFRRVA